jgi:hypothetical protein
MCFNLYFTSLICCLVLKNKTSNRREDRRTKIRTRTTTRTKVRSKQSSAATHLAILVMIAKRHDSKSVMSPCISAILIVGMTE